jgi:hypothetical protein
MSKNIKKYQKWVLDCYDVKNSQKRWGSCVLKKKQSKKVKKHITINDENTKKYRKYWQLVTNCNRLKKREGTNCPPPYKNIILIRWFLSLVDVL